MRNANTIKLFWWNEKIMHNKSQENYGDLLGKYLVEKISGKKAVFTSPKKFSISHYFSPIYVTIGSILSNVNKFCVVWGSGIITKNSVIQRAKFLAVRGPQTRNALLQQGYEVPEVFGDPALLLPCFFHPKVSKEYKYGIVPHYVDKEKIECLFQNRKDILIIDLMTNDIESKTEEFLKCEKIISSSLHGVIVSHAYGIPAVWQKFSNKVFGDDIKYQDYFESVQMQYYVPSIQEEVYSEEELLNLFINLPSLPDKKVLANLCVQLLEVCPFKSPECNINPLQYYES